MITIAHLASLSLLTLANSLMLGMDPGYPQLQINKLEKKTIMSGKLFIDHLENKASYPTHVCSTGDIVEYLIDKNRQKYHWTENFKNIPLHVPFIHVIISPDPVIAQNKSWPIKKIHTIMPAYLLINYNDKSKIEFPTETCIFQLNCTKNENLDIDHQYFPADKPSTTFEAQFLACMNQFYKKPSFCSNGDQTNIQELVRNNILQKQ
jgi:hypothetical protein